MTTPAGCIRWNSRLGSSRACILLDIQQDALLLVLDEPACCKGNGKWVKPEIICLKTGMRTPPPAAWKNTESALRTAWALPDSDASFLAAHLVGNEVKKIISHVQNLDRLGAEHAVNNLLLQRESSEAAERAAVAHAKREAQEAKEKDEREAENMVKAREFMAAQQLAQKDAHRKRQQEREHLYIEKNRSELTPQKPAEAGELDAVIADITNYLRSSIPPPARLCPESPIYASTPPSFMGITPLQKHGISQCTQDLIGKKCLLKGPWDYGFCLDIHTISSTPIGVSSSGKTQFDTKRTLAGEWMNLLKYHGQGNKNVPSISLFGYTLSMGGDPHMNKLKDLMGPHFSILDGTEIIVIPPSRPHSGTTPAPLLIAQELARLLKLDGSKKILSPFKKTNNQQAKEVPSHERGDWAKRSFMPTMSLDPLNGKRILLVDDLFQTGSTLRAIGNLIRQANPATFIAFTVTRNRKGY